MIYQVVGNYKMKSQCVYKMTPKNPDQVKGQLGHNVGSKGCLYEIHFPDLRELLVNHCQGFIKCSFHIVIELKQMALFRSCTRAPRHLQLKYPCFVVYKMYVRVIGFII